MGPCPTVHIVYPLPDQDVLCSVPLDLCQQKQEGHLPQKPSSTACWESDETEHPRNPSRTSQGLAGRHLPGLQFCTRRPGRQPRNPHFKPTPLGTEHSRYAQPCKMTTGGFLRGATGHGSRMRTFSLSQLSGDWPTGPPVPQAGKRRGGGWRQFKARRAPPQRAPPCSGRCAGVCLGLFVLGSCPAHPSPLAKRFSM